MCKTENISQKVDALQCSDKKTTYFIKLFFVQSITCSHLYKPRSLCTFPLQKKKWKEKKKRQEMRV